MEKAAFERKIMADNSAPAEPKLNLPGLTPDPGLSSGHLWDKCNRPTSVVT
jgi:hypothetical protein